MTEFITLLETIKDRAKVVPAPPVAETVRDGFDRMGVRGKKARLTGSTYMALARHPGFVVERFVHHALLRWGPDLYLVWLERTERGVDHWGTRLSKTQTDKAVCLRGIRDMKVADGFALTALGFGPVFVGGLRPGDRFADLDRRPGVVTATATNKVVEVVLSPDTLHADRQWWPGTVQVFVADAETATRATVRGKRRPARTRRPAKKG